MRKEREKEWCAKWAGKERAGMADQSEIKKMPNIYVSILYSSIERAPIMSMSKPFASEEERHRAKGVSYQVNVFYKSTGAGAGAGARERGHRVVRPPVLTAALLRSVRQRQAMRGRRSGATGVMWVRRGCGGGSGETGVENAEHGEVSDGVRGWEVGAVQEKEPAEKMLEDDEVDDDELEMVNEYDVKGNSGLYSSDEEGDTITDVYSYGMDRRFHIV